MLSARGGPRPRQVPRMGNTRLVSVEDAPSLVERLRENRDFLAPWEPTRDDDFFTVATQRDLLETALRAYSDGTMLPLAILDDAGTLVGRLTVSGITRGAFQSGSVGYWVSRTHNGRGIATRAVAETKKIAFTELGLHRLQAETLIHNTASQRVLKRNGFVPYGIAPQYLKIAGEWQEHVLYQVLNQAPEKAGGR
ncbi:GNAT family protein [Streptosporangium sp. NPDC000239]|uniref:GNAT family N-acetyltransferase n=1 Tax=Streptosporangium sp. NPDC000239 TaxID=3154248 RepID=UPI003320D407